MDDAQFRAWKTQLVPLMYDWFTNHKLNWPSQACRCAPNFAALLQGERMLAIPLPTSWSVADAASISRNLCSWGPMLENHNFRTKHRIYISEQVRGREHEGS